MDLDVRDTNKDSPYPITTRSTFIDKAKNMIGQSAPTLRAMPVTLPDVNQSQTLQGQEQGSPSGHIGNPGDRNTYQQGYQGGQAGRQTTPPTNQAGDFSYGRANYGGPPGTGASYNAPYAPQANASHGPRHQRYAQNPAQNSQWMQPHTAGAGTLQPPTGRPMQPQHAAVYNGGIRPPMPSHPVGPQQTTGHQSGRQVGASVYDYYNNQVSNPGNANNQGNLQTNTKQYARSLHDDMNASYQEMRKNVLPSTWDASSTDRPYHGNPFSGTILGAEIKVVSWAILRVLLDIYNSDTEFPAPGENIGRTGTDQDIVRRYIMAINGLAIPVLEYCRGSETEDNDIYVNERVVTPLLSIVHRAFPLYGKKLSLPPTLSLIRDSAEIGRSTYQLHSLFSALYKTFFSARFSYNNVPLRISIHMAHAALKLILRYVFAISPVTKKLERESLFAKVAMNASLLKGISAADFIYDKAPGNDFYKVSVISNLLLNPIREAAISSLYYMSEMFPVVANKLHSRQVEQLQCMDVKGIGPEGQ